MKNWSESLFTPMPSDYQCNACNLRFSIGWFHYHVFGSGYGSSTLIVCSKCGAQHSVEHGISDRGPEFRYLCNVVITRVDPKRKLQAMQMVRNQLRLGLAEVKQALENVPLVLATEISESDVPKWRVKLGQVGLEADFPRTRQVPNLLYGPQKKDRMLCAMKPSHTIDSQEMRPVATQGPYSGPTSAFVVGNQNCAACGTTHSLLATWPENEQVCPNCKSASLVCTGHWIT